MSYAISQRTSVKPSDSRWLLVAVILHALVLIIPLRELPPVSISQSAELVVRLVMGQPVAQEEIVPDKVPAEPVREILAPRPRVADIVELNAPESVIEPQPRENSESMPGESTPGMSTARLFSLRDTLTDKVPMGNSSANENAELGKLRAYSTPENWQPHAGAKAFAPTDNTFNGMSVPENVEIVDRWVATDGSRNVVIETPNGLRLCGRAPASDPMRPYIENVMSFHVCGGDGAIPFKFKPREPLDRDFIDPVAKDANQP